MRLLGVDPGEARVGLAISDPEGRYALPLEVVPAGVAFPAIRSIVKREGITRVVIGLARLPSGDEGDSVAMARRLGNRLAREFEGGPVEICYEDETLTTSAAEGLVGTRNAEADAVAASLLLQQFIDHGRDRETHALD